MGVDWGDLAGWGGFFLGAYSTIRLIGTERVGRRYAALASLAAQLKRLESTAISYFLSPEDVAAREKSAAVLAQIRDIGMEFKACEHLLKFDVTEDWMKLRQAITLNDFQSASRQAFEPSSPRIKEIEARASTLIALVYLRLRDHNPL